MCLCFLVRRLIKILFVDLKGYMLQNFDKIKNYSQNLKKLPKIIQLFIEHLMKILNSLFLIK